jgi:hypothetical protein
MGPDETGGRAIAGVGEAAWVAGVRSRTPEPLAWTGVARDATPATLLAEAYGTLDASIKATACTVQISVVAFKTLSARTSKPTLACSTNRWIHDE